MSNIINLKDYSDIYLKEESEYEFLKAYATNSRLMGVIGIRMHYRTKADKKLTLFFHLDFEEYGFDRFEVSEINNIDKITQSVMGGLGAELIELSLEEASTLIYSAITVGDKYLNDIPIDFYDYEYLIDEDCEDVTPKLLEKVCINTRTDEELINYFMMRTVGRDYDIRDMLLSADNIEYSLVDEPTVLLKNEVTKSEDCYLAKSIIDYYDSYKMIISEIRIKNNKVLSSRLVDEMTMTCKEASFQLNKTEYLTVFYVESPVEFKIYLEGIKPELLKNIYHSGDLYTEFNKTNDHVNQNSYYLNGDVYGSYYVTNEHHIVISCFDHDKLIKVKNELLKSFSMINELAELKADVPILYDFITSNNFDFFTFLGD